MLGLAAFYEWRLGFKGSLEMRLAQPRPKSFLGGLSSSFLPRPVKRGMQARRAPGRTVRRSLDSW